MRKKWFLKFQVTKRERDREREKRRSKNHYSSLSLVFIVKPKKSWLKVCTLFLGYSQIWLNIPMDDCHFGYKQKFLKNPRLLITILNYSPYHARRWRYQLGLHRCWFAVRPQVQTKSCAMMKRETCDRVGRVTWIKLKWIIPAAV